MYVFSHLSDPNVTLLSPDQFVFFFCPNKVYPQLVAMMSTF